MLRCCDIDSLAPRSFNLRSRDLSLPLPSGAGFVALNESGSSRCDSFRSRCKARSFFKLAASAVSSSVDFACCFLIALSRSFEAGGLDDLFEVSVAL